MLKTQIKFVKHAIVIYIISLLKQKVMFKLPWPRSHFVIPIFAT